uniref:Uncharacterized protein n=1 Tax=Anguilla anguilla TaxID=7936 RepID=A0A0E9RQL2_ANGAN
MSGRREREKEC